MREQQLYIGGAWVGTDIQDDVFDRWTGELLGSVHRASGADALRAVDAAQAALERGFPVANRAAVLSSAAKYISDHAEEFAQSIRGEIGKPITASRTEVQRAVSTLQFASEEARRLPSETVPLDATAAGEGMIGFTIAQPRGIVAAITPFNFPLNLVVHKIGPAIAAGCPVVLKPSDRARLTAGLLVDAFIAGGIPAGQLNLVTGRPEDVVAAWQKDDRVAVITFTGSSKIGWSLKAASPRKLHILELGSNTAMVVAADADVERAARDTVTAALTNSGQACISLQRVYVDRAVSEEYLESVKEKFEKVAVGDPRADETLVGPLVADVEVARIDGWLREAVSGGATIVAGGEPRGSILPPTLIVNARAEDRVVCEEIFGPVVTVTVVDSLDEAISGVNNSLYGLNTAIYTASLAMALKYSREAEAGSVLVNVPPSFRADQMPYGGVKDSGQGREGVKYAVAEMTEQKLVILAS
jgi:acyl-CoA reductase-like NAD-dependent aldehyde dehydrogenase